MSFRSNLLEKAKLVYPNRTASSSSLAGEAKHSILYDGHYPISPCQRIGLTFIGALSAFTDPRRADMVALLGETTGHVSLNRMRQRMMETEEGRKILEEKPIITERTVDFAYLSKLADGTFGKEYAKFMSSHHFTPDSRDRVKFVDDSALAYVMTRYRQVHDMGHILTDLPPTLEGEIALKWYEMVQTGLPMTTLSAIIGPAKLSREKKQRLVDSYIPWALKTASKSVPLYSVYHEKNWENPVHELRESLRIEPAPKI